MLVHIAGVRVNRHERCNDQARRDGDKEALSHEWSFRRERSPMKRRRPARLIHPPRQLADPSMSSPGRHAQSQLASPATIDLSTLKGAKTRFHHAAAGGTRAGVRRVGRAAGPLRSAVAVPAAG